METLSYSDFSLNLHHRVMAQRVPSTGVIEVTRRCPLNCVHCYNRLPLSDQEAKSNELTYGEHCRLIDEMTEAGCLWLLYTGGEIFARKDFLEIYTYAKKKGLLITLFTNGILITPEIANTLADWRPFCIEISLYGCTPRTYEQVTGVKGSFERVMRGIHLLRERGLPLKLKTVVMSMNKHEIWETKRFVEEELGLEFRFDAMINPCIDCSKKPLAVRLSPEEVVAFDVRDPKRMAEWKRFAEKFNGPAHPPERMDELYHCGGGMNSFAIDPCGKLRICVLSCRNAYDLRKGGFRDGWENFLFQERFKKISRVTKCTSCEIKSMCGMCPANGELENRDAEEPVDFLCQVAHLRAKALGMPVKPHGDCKYCETQERPNGLEG
jgi:radical SAM protein with 4Fe4S-binding SPASM domain